MSRSQHGGAGLIAVVVPARDEEQLIGRCLQSIVLARSRLLIEHPEVGCRVVVVADSCLDDTARIAQSIPGVQVVTSAAGQVGAARSLGIRTVLDDAPEVAGADCWLANTDADTVVPENWLSYQWQLGGSGADAMIGTVRPDPADLTPSQWERWRSGHRPGHPNGHVHGANLGIRAGAYQQAGGFPTVAEHEDNLIIDRLRALGRTLIASDACEVITSGRRIGRTPGGYANHLAVSL
ncbi:glycosyl transferase [Microlunatus endophyticus]|uniref:4,4'-diaponeurosporenoate glycosyltransferase n=1 Tax=Microlunatus endophyticus TaxID=1716077 RepID=A0A917SGE9_9ACTN|nr:glycosyltransferase [Microlunatus endophyticus]GGL76910.1 glycosyl transferase [Microlunatus endophyticus]